MPIYSLRYKDNDMLIIYAFAHQIEHNRVCGFFFKVCIYIQRNVLYIQCFVEQFTDNFHCR